MVKTRGKLEIITDRLTDVEKPRYSLKTPGLINLRNFFHKRNFDTGFENSFFWYNGYLFVYEILATYVKGKYITRLTKNCIASAAIQQPCFVNLQVFGKVGKHCRGCWMSHDKSASKFFDSGRRPLHIILQAATKRKMNFSQFKIFQVGGILISRTHF